MATILITGINGRLATLVAQLLAARPDTRVVGVGHTLPTDPPAGVELLQLDSTSQALQSLLQSTGAEALIHLDQSGEELADPLAAQRARILHTIEALGAAIGAGVRRVVLRSSTLVYGAGPDLPAFVDETAPLRPAGHARLQRDYVEVERLAGELLARHAEVMVTILRCAAVLGAQVPSPMAVYLGQPMPRVLLGFDPRIQVLHAHDAAAAFVLAAQPNMPPGAYNLAAADPLPLSRAIRLAGGMPLALPEIAFEAARRLGNSGTPLTGMLPFDVPFFRYACVADTCRAREILGWAPEYSAEDAIRDV